jgi:hypothetical protein
MLREWIGFVAACNVGWLFGMLSGRGSRSVVVLYVPQWDLQKLTLAFMTDGRTGARNNRKFLDGASSIHHGWRS